MATTEAGGGVPGELWDKLLIAYAEAAGRRFTNGADYDAANFALSAIAAAGYELVAEDRLERLCRSGAIGVRMFSRENQLGAQGHEALGLLPGDLDQEEGR
jgi:hypothetical protein